MSRTLAQRMGVAPGQRPLALDPPKGYAGLLGAPGGVRIATVPALDAAYDRIRVFVREAARVERHAAQVLPPAAGRDAVSRVAVDADWSALRFRPVAEIAYTPGSKRAPAGGRGQGRTA